MKKLLALAVFLFAAPLYADVTISNTFTDGQAARIERARARVNAASCAYRGLPASCNTTQLREQYCKSAGFGGQPIPPPGTGFTPLTATCPGATQFIVYGTAETFVKRTMLEKVDEWTKQDEAADKAAAKAAWDAKTQAQRDALCPSFGLTAPCTPF